MIKLCEHMHSESAKQEPKSSKLTVAEDPQYISPVECAHDPVPNAPTYIAVPDDTFLPRLVAGNALKFLAIRLRPRASHLPYRCSLDEIYESKFWRSGLEPSTESLRLLAADRSATDFVVGNGIILARLAQTEMHPGLEHRFCKASTYMYSFASEERTKLLASSMVLMFLLDGTFPNFQEDPSAIADARLQMKEKRTLDGDVSGQARKNLWSRWLFSTPVAAFPTRHCQAIEWRDILE